MLTNATAHDLAALASLPPSERARVMRLQSACEGIAAAPHGSRCSVVEMSARCLGISAKGLHRIYARWKDSGRNWMSLTDGRRNGQVHMTGLPSAFAAWVAAKHEQHQRDTTGDQVARAIYSQWQRWRSTGNPAEAIPGYDEPPPAGLRGYPAGWSVKNLLRCRPAKFNLRLARQGSKAASAFLPSVLTTRAGLAFGQRIFFDDQEYDQKVVLPGVQRIPMRPVGFNAIDHLSGAFLDYCLKLKRLDDDGTVRTLTKQDFTWFVLRLLIRIGYRNDALGTELIFEHGTADAFRSQNLTSGSGHHTFDDAIASVTGGRVTIERSGRFGDPAFAGLLFRGAASGNFRFKSPIESMFNLVRNYSAVLPGATGRNFHLAPEEQPGIEREDERLLAVWQNLSEERRALIPHFHHLTFQEFSILYRDIYRAINTRTSHTLEGWEKCGFTTAEFTLDDASWMPREKLLALPEHKRDAVAAVATWRERRLSPSEVAEAHKSELTRLPWTAIPLVIPTEWARPAKVNEKHTIKIKDALIDPEPLHYIAQAITASGRRETLSPGDEVLCYLNPFDPSEIVTTDMSGRLIGMMRQQIRPTAGSADVYPTIGRINQLRRDLAINTEEGFATIMEEREHLVALRRNLENGDPATEEEQAEARSLVARNAAAARLGREDESTWDAIAERDEETTATAPSADLSDFL